MTDIASSSPTPMIPLNRAFLELVEWSSRGSPGKSQKEGKDDQGPYKALKGLVRHLRAVGGPLPLALLRSPDPAGLPSGWAPSSSLKGPCGPRKPYESNWKRRELVLLAFLLVLS